MFDDSEKSALIDVLEKTDWWYGDNVRNFEEEFAAFQGAPYCLTITSGTTALELCIQALDIGPGDEVIIPPFTFFATASAVSRMGAKPVFADIDDSWNIDPDQIEAVITSNTKAISPVHFSGRICDMDRINEIAEKHDLYVVEDACHSWGAKWNGKAAGILGTCGVSGIQKPHCRRRRCNRHRRRGTRCRHSIAHKLRTRGRRRMVRTLSLRHKRTSGRISSGTAVHPAEPIARAAGYPRTQRGNSR